MRPRHRMTLNFAVQCSICGVNHLGTYGRWAFAEFTEVFQIQADSKATIDANFNKLIEGFNP